MEESEIIENGLYRRTPKEGESTWCRLNLLIASHKSGEWIFTDLYWSSYQGQTRYKFYEIKDRIEFVFDMNFAEEVSKQEYKQYDEKDTCWIPMGGSSEKYLVDSRATKSRNVIIKLLEERIIELNHSIESMKREIKQKEETLKSVKSGGSIEHIWIK